MNFTIEIKMKVSDIVPLDNTFHADFYLHKCTKIEILKKYPLESGIFDKKDYQDKKFTLTYDVHTAYDLRTRNIPVLVWGKKERTNHQNGFVFLKNKPKKIMF